ncbi:MAG: SLBB domain-containing protein [Muribaculaceae bacterium]|nr:SLBB domain-containing protein [Muribaculaceae bacterium]
MKKRNLLLLLLMSIAMLSWAMTDQQVIAYIKQQAAAGKSQEQIGQELLAKGVTPEQAQRIKAQYEAQQAAENASGTMTAGSSRTRTSSQNNKAVSKKSSTKTSSKSSSKTKTSSTKTSKTSKSSTTGSEDELMEEEEVDIFASSLDEMLWLNEEEMTDTIPEKIIFGHDIFNTNQLTFEPNVNVGTPQNYLLGPGDEVIIDIWGANEEHLRQIISPEGAIMVDQLGPVYLNGMTINQANNHIKNAFSKKYSGVNDSETDISLTLGETRSVIINVMGEVETPGTFLVSPFSSVFNALYLAGGINDIGSLRNIQVLRNGRKVAGVDVYDYIMNGKSDGNITLQEGDVVIVPPYEQLVNITGNVKRPMYYEMLPQETVETLIGYAGGFAGDAYSGMVRLQRHTGFENELYNVENNEFNVYHLQDGDIVTVGTVLDRYTNKVELQGSVMRPGMYAIGPNVSTVAELLGVAEGLKEDAYTGRALLYREGPELQLQVMALDLGEILTGRAPDVELKKNDVLVVSSIEDIIDRGVLTIDGQVAFPGEYPYAENTTLEDLILQAGGLLEGASTARIDVARRIVDPAATEQTEQLAKIFSLSIDQSLRVGSGVDFKLQPYDMVHVRQSPGYEPQASVSVNGEVLFAGDYVLEKRNERVSDLIRRAGGVLDAAYVKGAHLERKLSEDEYESRKEALRLAMAQNQESGGDSIALTKIEVAETYNVGIDLEKALAYPGSHYDLVLVEGDQLYIPQFQSTVKISGDVMFPNSVVYEPGKKLGYYIDQAGGYGERAKKGKAFIVYLNGTVAKAKRSSPIEPGCQIIVPSKAANSGVNWTQIMALASSFTSVATLAATILNIFR